jgi:transmembrane sensor
MSKWVFEKRHSIVIAVFVLLSIAFVTLFYRTDLRKSLLVAKHDVGKEVVSGKKMATLTLINGQKIRLTDSLNGPLSMQAGVSVFKSGSGEVTYQFPTGYEREDQLHPVRNILNTGNGETYSIILPDGTKAWLNAMSSLKFDPQLHSKLRVVELSGEVYFEVAKDDNRPFIVASKRQQIEVLWAHFNVCSYLGQDSVQTTLLNGSIRIVYEPEDAANQPRSIGLNTVILKPNQKAVLGSNNLFTVTNIDAIKAIAWKNEYFTSNRLQ